MIRVENLSKNYGPVKAVRSISFDLNDGQVVGFLGANGAGKSTTLKIMTGYISPTAGNVYYNDHDINNYHPAGQGTGPTVHPPPLAPGGPDRRARALTGAPPRT